MDKNNNKHTKKKQCIVQIKRIKWIKRLSLPTKNVLVSIFSALLLHCVVCVVSDLNVVAPFSFISCTSALWIGSSLAWWCTAVSVSFAVVSAWIGCAASELFVVVAAVVLSAFVPAVVVVVVVAAASAVCLLDPLVGGASRSRSIPTTPCSNTTERGCKEQLG